MEATENQSERKSLVQVLFGGDLKSGKAWSIFATRIALGIVFLWAGYEKIVKEWGTGALITQGFLGGVKGPFAFMFTPMSGNPVVDVLLVYGELAIGISLVAGFFTRVGGISGALMTLLLYLSTLPAQPATVSGSYFDFLMNKNALFSYYIIYVFVFVAFVFLVPGRFLGVDGILQHVTSGIPSLKKVLAKLG